MSTHAHTPATHLPVLPLALLTACSAAAVARFPSACASLADPSESLKAAACKQERWQAVRTTHSHE